MSGGATVRDRLLERHRKRLRRMIAVRLDRRLAARVDPSDVLQEAFLDAARQVDNYLKDPRVVAYIWLRGLAWKRLLKLQRDHLGAQRRAVSREVALPGNSSIRLAQQLMAQGLDRHKAIHAIASVLINHIQDVVSDPAPENDQNPRYHAALRRLTAKKWLRSG